MPENTNDKLYNYLSEETKTLLNFIFDGIYVVDTTGKIAFWNKGAEKITGYMAEEVIGNFCKDNILNHIDSDGTLVCIHDCPLKIAINENRSTQNKLYPLRKDGRRIPVLTHIAPIKSSGGEIIGAIEVFRDISVQEEFEILQKKFDKLIKQYVSDTAYESVMQQAAGDREIKAEARDMAVFYMDIVGFTTLTEKNRPQEVVEMLNAFFSLSSHIIKKHTGDIDKFIGDCVMAVFIDSKDAAEAAREFLLDGLKSLNKKLAESNLPQINVRVGINTGELISGAIGSELRKDYTVIGDVVNTAARVQAEAEPGTLYISESTLSRLPNISDFEFVKQILLKGKLTPVKLYKMKNR
ncbi:MAG TPA: adenylate/guanylate cyclase domain-containing protein [Candidatus Wallbacteria bacterium]|nr:adenylate/guanylate cyclase domain-containing protein [Candidatus Wallbacteria bacterium]